MVDRGSARHSPRIDEQLSRDTRSLTRGSPVEARAEEWHQMEPAADGEPVPGARISVDEIEQRSMLAIALRPSAFPGDRDTLTGVAVEEHAEDAVLTLLARLPARTVYPTFESVWEALGGRAETRERERPPAPIDRAAGAPHRLDPLGEGVGLVLGAATSLIGFAIGVTTGIVRRLRRIL